MKLNFFGQTDIGRKRKINQDAYLINDEIKLFAVADGMGGHQGGEVASKMCVNVLNEYCVNNDLLDPSQRLSGGINAACAAIFHHSREHEELEGMGTTVICLLFSKEKVFIGQVGDSRCYLVAGDGIWQVTEDHSLLNEELRAGRLQMDQIQDYQFKNVITRSVGYESHVTVDVYERKVRPGDTFLLCSDGLSGLLEPAEMREILLKNPLKVAVANLISLANDRGGDDNITVLGCQVL